MDNLTAGYEQFDSDYGGDESDSGGDSEAPQARPVAQFFDITWNGEIFTISYLPSTSIRDVVEPLLAKRGATLADHLIFVDEAGSAGAVVAPDTAMGQISGGGVLVVPSTQSLFRFTQRTSLRLIFLSPCLE